MRHAIQLAMTAAALALASAGAFGMGDKSKNRESAARGGDSTESTRAGNAQERAQQGATSSGLPVGEGTTTAEAARQRAEKKGGTTDDNLGRHRPDELPKGEKR
ncbi:MAG TPA: hypothetical protein VEC19_12600 [Usitatibacter sp.]|nr:hypothetical protein [Usitatibacter sp.]